MAHRQRRLRVKKLPGAREQQLDVVVQLRHRAHGGARRAHRIGLVNRNRGRHALHAVHRRFVHAVEKLPRVGAEGFHIAPLPFGIQRVKHQAGLARAARPRHHRHLARANVHVQVFQVVLARAAQANQRRGGAGRGWLKRGARSGCRTGNGSGRTSRSFLFGHAAHMPAARRFSSQPGGCGPLLFQEQIQDPKNASIARFDGLGCY